jgi:NADH:ubiquinone oxidoreductase subunit 6 (subunit J)
MEIIFIILAVMTLGSGLAAMMLRNLVHCALCIVVTFGGLAALYLQLNAQFVGFAQVLVYIGAVAILIVFAIMLTRGGEEQSKAPLVSGSWLIGVLVALVVLVSLVFAIVHSPQSNRPLPAAPPASTRQIGEQLMSNYVLPLETLALLLTAAMIGAVVIAMREEPAASQKATEGHSAPADSHEVKKAA